MASSFDIELRGDSTWSLRCSASSSQFSLLAVALGVQRQVHLSSNQTLLFNRESSTTISQAPISEQRKVHVSEPGCIYFRCRSASRRWAHKGTKNQLSLTDMKLLAYKSNSDPDKAMVVLLFPALQRRLYLIQQSHDK